MRWPVLAFALAGLTGMAGSIYLAGQQGRLASDATIAVEPIEMPVAPTPEAPTAAISSQTRAIMPDKVAPPPIAREELVRVEPRQPLSPIGRAGRHGPDGPRPSMLFSPLAVAAGVVKSGNYTVQLAGIEVVPADEKCSYRGREWNCGIVARTAFRNFLRGRALSCVLPDETGDGNLTLPCTLGKEDPALWLARYGWAKAGADGAYADALEEARRQGLGIFGPPPGALGQSG